MRVAVLKPNHGFLAGEKSMHRWADVFIQHFADACVDYESAKTYKGDCIVSLNGRPELPGNCPPLEFNGIKAVHLMDHSFNAKDACGTLQANNITAVMGYARHDVLDPFYQDAFRSYQGKFIEVPFGFDTRFVNRIAFGERRNKCVGLGAINLVNEGIPDLKDYTAFFGASHKWAHPWRHKLREQIKKGNLRNELCSRFPKENEFKNFDYDIVEEYNRHKMFTTCESIMSYPSVKTYEGMACGSVFVGNKVPCYEMIGLQDKVNCLLHEPGSVTAFKEAVNWGQEHPHEMQEIARKGQRHVEANFSPKVTAQGLYQDLSRL